MPSRALQHFLERAAERHSDRFDDWFLPSFDWRALAEDAPEMARRLGAQVPGLEGERQLQQAAEAVFRAAHVASLAVLCALSEGDADPDHLLARITRLPDEEEEERIQGLIEAALGPIERAMSAEESEGIEGDAERAMGIAERAWPSVREPIARAVAEGGEEEEAAAVLLGIARVASVLAAFRWMAAQEANEDWPVLSSDDEDADGGPWE